MDRACQVPCEESNKQPRRIQQEAAEAERLADQRDNSRRLGHDLIAKRHRERTANRINRDMLMWCMKTGFPRATMLAGRLLLSLCPRVAYADGTVLTCANPFSGATWDIAVDFDRRLADSFPAEITDRRIIWHDVLHGGICEFDRASGFLDGSLCLGHGGYALHDQCRVRR